MRARRCVRLAKILAVLETGWRAGRHYRCAHRTRRRCSELSGARFAGRRMEAYRTACAHHTDRLPLRRPMCPLVYLPVHLHGRYYGRRVALEVFACRKCYGLAYASQQGGLQFRNLRQSQRIRTRLGAARTPASPYPTSPAACISERMSALRRWRNRLKRLRAGAAEQASNFLASSMNCVDCV